MPLTGGATCTDTLVPHAAPSSQVLKSEGRVKLQPEAMEIKKKRRRGKKNSAAPHPKPVKVTGGGSNLNTVL